MPRKTPGVPKGTRIEKVERPRLVGSIAVPQRPRVQITDRPNSLARPGQGNNGNFRKAPIGRRASTTTNTSPGSRAQLRKPGAVPMPVAAPRQAVLGPVPYTPSAPVEPAPPSDGLDRILTPQPTPGTVGDAGGSFQEVTSSGVPLQTDENLTTSATTATSPSWLPIAAALAVAFLVMRH